MSTNKKVILMIMLMSMIGIKVFAYEFSVEIDGITYYFDYTNNGTELALAKGSIKYSGDFVIPEEVTYMNRTRKVTKIGYKAFSWADITSLTVPNIITSVGDYAFEGCSLLKKVIIKDVAAWCRIEFAENYGNPLFYARHLYSDDNTEITDLVIPKEVTNIGREAFDDCDFQTVTSLIEEPFEIVGKNSSFRTFSQNTFNNATFFVPKGTAEKYKKTKGWNNFLFIEEVNEKCERPTITYQNGELLFHSATEGAMFHYSITDSDIKEGNTQKVQLDATYNISAYATKAGYENSETATATLCWIDVEPKTEGINSVAQVRANAVMIKAEGGQLIVEGGEDNTNISVYTLDGVQLGSTIIKNGYAHVNTNNVRDSIAIIKIGSKSIKVAMKYDSGGL